MTFSLLWEWDGPYHLQPPCPPSSPSRRAKHNRSPFQVPFHHMLPFLSRPGHHTRPLLQQQGLPTQTHWIRRPGGGNKHSSVYTPRPLGCHHQPQPTLQRRTNLSPKAGPTGGEREPKVTIATREASESPTRSEMRCINFHPKPTPFLTIRKYHAMPCRRGIWP